mmetsp:Transcript_23037/g.48845  ORF Transcript_23037/g.48845 Transcript_23037/m.48845 type:complete len:350 (-) Transcript_23037:414-1463(-)
MVLKVLAHRWQVGHALDAVLLEVLLGSDAAEHEKVRGAHGPGRQDDLTPILETGSHGLPVHRVVHPRRLALALFRPALDRHLGHLRARDHIQVGVLQHAGEVGRSSAASHAILLHHVKRSHAHLPLVPVVEVRVSAVARTLARVQERVNQLVRILDRRHTEGAGLAVELVVAHRVVRLRLLEILQNVLGGPPWYLPFVKVACRSSVVEQDVRAGASPEHLAPAQVNAVVVWAQAGLRLARRREVPVKLGFEDATHRGRHLDVLVLVVRRAGLQDQQAVVLVRVQQPLGQRAGRGASADEDVVILVGGRRRSARHQEARRAREQRRGAARMARLRRRRHVELGKRPEKVA